MRRNVLAVVKNYATTWLLALTFFIAEVHTYWHNNRIVENWIWVRPTPMLLQWNIKYASDQLIWIIVIFAMLCYGKTPNRLNRAAVLTYLFWVVFDTIVYFYNFKTYGYGYMYFWLLGILTLIYFQKDITTYLWKQLQDNRT